MMDKDQKQAELIDALRCLFDDKTMRFNEPMSEHTTFKIGGPADIFVTPRDATELMIALDTCRLSGVPYFVLGLGSDLLVGDKGYRGTVICMPEQMNAIKVEGTTITAEAGASLKDVCQAALDAGLSGLEFACGIPGSVGGACFMNAGAYDGQIQDVLESVEVINSTNDPKRLMCDELDFGYRSSRIKNEGLCVISARFMLEPKDKASIKARMDELTEKRESKQPLELPSAGSTFKRPEGYFAGKLIMDAGLQGRSVGGAQVSTKHAGFVVNADNATAKDVKDLIEVVQKEVKEQFGVDMEPEVRFIGEF